MAEGDGLIFNNAKEQFFKKVFEEGDAETEMHAAVEDVGVVKLDAQGPARAFPELRLEPAGGGNPVRRPGLPAARPRLSMTVM